MAGVTADDAGDMSTSVPRRVPLPIRILGYVLATYLVGRGVAEFFVIDLHDPSSYRLDWGGPSLAGVLAVHSGPAVLIVAWLVRRTVRS